ncbi:serine/threonine protein kinase with Chase2 sensor [Calothrix sp. NIES-4071]|nr:serine/threonine protein kinase with Chase2 sensor [Calothrix sp. NIES-4071]BAZ62812.1 serine/threonine protein kinase with Chase2 sensor [Calothrix sp. NIES-4105]
MFKSLKKIFTKSQSVVLLSGAVVTMMLVGIQKLGVLEGLELRVYDQMQQLRASPGVDSRLLIVGVTEKDVRKWGWPLSGEILDRLLGKLDSFQPRAIGLDIFRDQPVNPGHDKLSERLRLSDTITPVCKHTDKTNIGTPPPQGIEAERVGFVDVAEDTDGIIRRNLLLLSPSQSCSAEFSFGLQLALKYLEVQNIRAEYINEELKLRNIIFKRLQNDFGGYRAADAGGYQVMLNYRSSKIAEQVTVTDILTDQVKPDLIKNRIVLIGSTAESLKDILKTPYSSGKLDNSGDMAGVEIHAQSVSQILSVVLNGQPLLWSLPEWGEVLLIGGCALIGGLLVWRLQHPLLLAVSGVSIIAVLFGGIFFIFTQAGWVPFVAPALGFVLSSGTMLAYTAYQAKQEQKEISHLVKQQKDLIAQLQAVSRESGVTLKQGTAASFLGEEVLRDTLLNTRYKIIDNLGSGGFSNTYLAIDTQRPGSPKCVVKQLRPASLEPDYLEILSRLFKTEAEILETLGKHKQIPQLMAVFEENQQFYIVQEFIRGKPLSQELLPGQRLRQSEVVNILKEVLEVLGFVHSYDIIHRDVKPSNLIRRESDEHIVLIDYGAVKQIIPEQQESLTIAIGTAGYAPPEQMAGIPRLNSDIYALGMLGIEALTGIAPKTYRRDSITNKVTIQVQTNANLRNWEEFTDATDELVAIIDKMVDIDFMQRYQVTADVLKVLENI